MQSDLEHSRSNISTQLLSEGKPGSQTRSRTLYNTYGGIPGSQPQVLVEERLVIGQGEKKQEHSSTPGDQEPLELSAAQRALQSQSRKISKAFLESDLPATQRRSRPSSAQWYFAALLGDGVILTTLLTLLFTFAPPFHSLRLHASPDGLGSIGLGGMWNSRLVWGCLALVSWGFVGNITRAQELSTVSSRFKSPLCASFALGLMVIFWVGFTWLFIGKETASSVRLELLFLGMATPILSAWRVLLAEIIGLPRFRPWAVIVGVNAAGETIARELQCAKHLGASVLGYISENFDERSHKDGLPILGSRSALRQLAHLGVIDIIIMSLDYKAHPELFQEAIEAAQHGISVVPMTMVYERTCGKIPVEHIGDQWYAALPSDPLISPLYLCWRNMVDISFGVIGTVLLLLLLPIIALLIYLDSAGPIFYRQERMGYRGKAFTILKFRSMRTDAELAGRGAVWAAEHDTRVTRVGRLMRATHLDELPQVLNILKGEMTLIGPRPERQVFVSRLENTIPFYRCRLSVKPGLTGWAQVKYPYASTDHDALIKLQYDLYYIKHQSCTLDIFIIVRTAIEMLLCHGR